MFLTHDQLVELTHYRQPGKQAAALHLMGIRYFRRPDRTVAVLAASLSAPPERATMAVLPRVRARRGKAKKT